MNRQRFDQRRADLRSASARLTAAASLPDDDITRDAVIQRFEFTLEAAWRALQLYLQHEGIEAGGPRQIVRSALADGLIVDADEAEDWFRMLDDRNLTTHTYVEPLARAIYDRVVRRYAGLLATMADRVDQLEWT